MQKVGASANRGTADRKDAVASDDMGLSFYTDPPNAEVSVREFEELTRDRLKVLHSLDRICGYNTPLEAVPDKARKLQGELADARMILRTQPNSSPEHFRSVKNEFVRRDAISHFAMRLSFCKTRDSRDWFLTQEQRLFVVRFEALLPDAQQAFLAKSGLQCKKVDLAAKYGDKGSLVEWLKLNTPAGKTYAPDGKFLGLDSTFYEMPFYEVSPNLIASRKVIVMQGKAYVPNVALKIILAKRYKECLTSALDVAFQALPQALADPRVGGFLRNLQDYGLQLLCAPKSSTEDVGEKLSLANFEELLTRSMPPCMRRLVEKQREMKKHLKHAGRLQLRPFLKDCGFTFEESVQWWKQELCKDPEIDATSYEKNYIYDTEHAYGKKGHLQGQNSFGCPKLINFPPEAGGQCHGCPFKQLDLPVLKLQLQKWQVPQVNIIEIEKLLTNGKHFQLACIEYFQAKHPEHSGDGLGNSPGDFFKESCKYYTKKNEKEGKGTTQSKEATQNSPEKQGGA